MKKIFATLLAMSMVLASTVAFAATPVETSVNPSLTLTASDIISMDMDDGLGERQFALVDANVILPEGTLSDKITYNSITKKATGTGIASFTLKVAFDADLFDMTTSYVVQTDGVGEWGYNANDKAMAGAMSGNANGMYVGTLEPMITYYVALSDNTATVESINASDFATITLADLRIETFESSTAATYSTLYSNDESKADFDFVTKVGTGTPVEEDPVITPDNGTIETDGKADAKTWAVAVDANYAAAGDVLVATLTNSAAEEGNKTQEVELTVGNDIEGGADWAFNLKVRFKDVANRATTTLAIAKKAAN